MLRLCHLAVSAAVTAAIWGLLCTPALASDDTGDRCLVYDQAVVGFGCGPRAAKPATQSTYAPPASGEASAPSRLDDWGKIHASGHFYAEVTPTTTAELQRIIKQAYEGGMPVRIRGRGHSMNGSSLPRDGELLVRTTRLMDYEFTSRNTIRVGTGISVTGLQMWVSRFGYSLPVHNDGQIGPSVGGWVNAGGFASGSRQYGGSWANITEITLIDGTGKLLRLKPDAPLFKWVFGSMGQLGVVAEVEFRLLNTAKAEEPALPKSGTMYERWKDSPEFAAEVERSFKRGKLWWFNIFAPRARKAVAAGELEKLRKKYPALLNYRPIFNYDIKHRGFTPPLIYPNETELVAVGLWGDLAQGQQAQDILKMEQDFRAVLAAYPDFRRYLQSEVLPVGFDFEAYFGPAVFKEFRAWKTALDPKNILNRGVFNLERN